ncbi:IS200/IS605 family transposase [Rickettsia endosymbiont of Oedothorax gibbosus]|uniref:IS200/IS605 family transposase n=1 Tax=Rickettsia endosymbiont of Oedothorax gibbosus TaxID=931099 RepID=UPI0020254B0F|nr:IS200/IS605 family transposase [Rickettsia endosymbiont of Oedothorax gibbosus]
MTDYSKSSHTVFYHRFHIVWITKYRYKVLTGNLRIRIREIIAQVAEYLGIKIINGILSADHVHIMAEIPPHISISQFVKAAKGRSSYKIQQEFPEIRKTYWGRHFWARGFFSSTSGNVTDDIINNYINNHSDTHQPNNVMNISLE